MADKVPLVHESKNRVVRAIRGLIRMTQICKNTNLSWTQCTSGLVGDSFSGSEIAPSRAKDNKTLCRPEEVASKDPRQ